MIEATYWGLVGGIALLIGALAGLRLRTSNRLIGLITAFGVGVLVSALAFELTREAFERGVSIAVVIGLGAGALTFYAGDWILDHHGGQDRKRSGGQQASGNGMAIVLGALLGGIPESVAIGVSLLGGGAVVVPVVAAVFLSNVPEPLSAATGLRKAGRLTRWILGLRTAVALVSALAAGLGFLLLGGAPPRSRSRSSSRSSRSSPPERFSPCWPTQ